MIENSFSFCALPQDLRRIIYYDCQTSFLQMGAVCKSLKKDTAKFVSKCIKPAMLQLKEFLENHTKSGQLSGLASHLTKILLEKYPRNRRMKSLDIKKAYITLISLSCTQVYHEVFAPLSLEKNFPPILEKLKSTATTTTLTPQLIFQEFKKVYLACEGQPQEIEAAFIKKNYYATFRLSREPSDDITCIIKADELYKIRITSQLLEDLKIDKFSKVYDEAFHNEKDIFRTQLSPPKKRRALKYVKHSPLSQAKK